MGDTTAVLSVADRIGDLCRRSMSALSLPLSELSVISTVIRRFSGVLAEFLDRELIEDALACRFEHNRRRVANLSGFDPPGETDTPAVARL